MLGPILSASVLVAVSGGGSIDYELNATLMLRKNTFRQTLLAQTVLWHSDLGSLLTARFVAFAVTGKARLTGRGKGTNGALGTPRDNVHALAADGRLPMHWSTGHTQEDQSQPLLNGRRMKTPRDRRQTRIVSPRAASNGAGSLPLRDAVSSPVGDAGLLRQQQFFESQLHFACRREEMQGAKLLDSKPGAAFSNGKVANGYTLGDDGFRPSPEHWLQVISVFVRMSEISSTAARLCIAENWERSGQVPSTLTNPRHSLSPTLLLFCFLHRAIGLTMPHLTFCAEPPARLLTSRNGRSVASSAHSDELGREACSLRSSADLYEEDIETDWNAEFEDSAGVSAPLYELVECVFDMPAQKFFRRQASMEARCGGHLGFYAGLQDSANEHICNTMHKVEGSTLVAPCQRLVAEQVWGISCPVFGK